MQYFSKELGVDGKYLLYLWEVQQGKIRGDDDDDDDDKLYFYTVKISA